MYSLDRAEDVVTLACSPSALLGLQEKVSNEAEWLTVHPLPELSTTESFVAVSESFLNRQATSHRVHCQEMK